ncbi:MAG: hypothetical protein H6699_06280 [Myxococcales bacterium]|nr:hypothetical protein [Myxococcales bacterium]
MSSRQHRLSPGDELVTTIATLCDAAGVAEAWIRAVGRADSARLRVGAVDVEIGECVLASFDARWRASNGGWQLRATAVVSFSTGGIPQTVAGEVTRLVCDDIDVVFVGGAEAPDGAVPTGSAPPPPAERATSSPAERRTSSPAAPSSSPASRPAPTPAPSGASSLERAPSPAPRPAEGRPAASPTRREAPAPSPAPASAWARVAAVSQAVSAGAGDDDEVDVDELQRGDVLLHPSLAKCIVVGVAGDDALNVRLANGSVRKLKMSELRLVREGSDRVFRIERKAR